ncbi:hypothetical protein BU23DRAFT_563647 [Bimuria novae-zelandiae CBS 107.79]|uniref:Mid2 domain-containing protein n=1 Tax=Bimuria novae-zelandiae CBS 107.79 TaxID=1447943 RepID=A0A6A5VSP8_9PLEO|nr:hypothetical protein BU23DRAFT_563647 [Bimuria novae-zelandiae CBS 107.79]
MRSSLPFLFASALPSIAQALCYDPNGTPTMEKYRNRCSADPSSPIYNICCAIDRPNPSGSLVVGTNWTADICLSNGICQNDYLIEGNPAVVSSYWRQACTDATVTSTSTSSSDAFTISLAPSTSAAPSAWIDLSSGAKAGMVIGAVASIAVMFGAGYMLARRKRHQKVSPPFKEVAEMGQHNAVYQLKDDYGVSGSQDAKNYQRNAVQHHEMSVEAPVQELPTTRK